MWGCLSRACIACIEESRLLVRLSHGKPNCCQPHKDSIRYIKWFKLSRTIGISQFITASHCSHGLTTPLHHISDTPLTSPWPLTNMNVFDTQETSFSLLELASWTKSHRDSKQPGMLHSNTTPRPSGDCLQVMALDSRALCSSFLRTVRSPGFSFSSSFRPSFTSPPSSSFCLYQLLIVYLLLGFLSKIIILCYKIWILSGPCLLGQNELAALSLPMQTERFLLMSSQSWVTVSDNCCASQEP